METQTPLRQQALAYQVLEILCSRISNKTYLPDTQLPPEIDLAEEFNVSRATIRRAMDLLVERGLISKRQGIGTFVTRPPDITNPLQQFIDFREMLRLQGFRPGLVELSAAFTEPKPKICEDLELDPNKLVLETHKYFTANDELVVYCVNHIPVWVFEDVMTHAEVVQPGVMEPILEFYEKRCGKKIEFYTCTVHAEIVKRCGLPYLSQNFKSDTPVLIVNEVGYGADNRPLHHSVEYHPGNHMQFGLIRLMEPAIATPQSEVSRRALDKLNGRISASGHNN
jgi:GntR family transcriptional regulator